MKLIYRLEVRIAWLMADLARETSRAAKAAVRKRLHNYRCWKHSSLTMHQHQRKQDSNDRRRKDMGHRLDKTKQVKYTNRNPLTLPWGGHIELVSP